MTARRVVIGLLAALALLLAWWVGRRSQEVRDVPRPELATRPPPPTAAVAVATASPGAVRHRLAGIVVGDLEYVVIEQPDGRSDLYEPGAEVPGLGRVIRIAVDGATFQGTAGEVFLPLLPAPTPTMTPIVATATTSPRPSPTPRRPGGRTFRESSP